MFVLVSKQSFRTGFYFRYRVATRHKIEGLVHPNITVFFRNIFCFIHRDPTMLRLPKSIMTFIQLTTNEGICGGNHSYFEFIQRTETKTTAEFKYGDTLTALKAGRVILYRFFFCHVGWMSLYILIANKKYSGRIVF